MHKPDTVWGGKFGFVQLNSGRVFNPLEPEEDIESILIEDIAHALSNLCRFGGHVSKFYSVGEHSCHCSDHVGKIGGDVEDMMHALLHDGTEALGMVDIPRPIKRADGFGGYRRAERRLERALEKRFGLCGDHELIAEADLAMLVTEKRDLLPKGTPPQLLWPEGIRPLREKVQCWTPPRAKREFLKRFERLSRERERVVSPV